MEDVNTRRRIFLTLSKLGCGLQEFNSRKFHLHLTFKANWNNQEDVPKKREFILIVTFSLPSPSSLLKLPTLDNYDSCRQLSLTPEDSRQLALSLDNDRQRSSTLAISRRLLFGPFGPVLRTHARTF